MLNITAMWSNIKCCPKIIVTFMQYTTISTSIKYPYHFFLCFLFLLRIFHSWRLINWLDSILLRIGNISVIWRWLLQIVKCDQFWNFEDSLAALNLHRNPVKQSFACQGGCYPWHRAPFNVPSDPNLTSLLNHG